MNPIHKRAAFLSTLILSSSATLAQPAPEGIPVNKIGIQTLDVSKAVQDWGKPTVDKSVGNHPLTIGGKTFEHGLGTHADGQFVIDLKGNALSFSAMVGVDDDTAGKGSVSFEVAVDGKVVARTGVIKGNDAAQAIQADLKGAKMLTLSVKDGGDGVDYDHADWADAQITIAAGANVMPEAKPAEAPVTDTSTPPIASGDPKEPAIHGPRVVGTTPGRPFLFKVPVTGEGAIAIAATDLPQGLSISDGIITGNVKTAGETVVHLSASSEFGKATRSLRIVAGDHKLAQTPPMGWNSWNVWGTRVTAENVKNAADAMISSGLAAKGFSYVNIDDAWEAKERAADGQITPNEKFGDIKALADYVHSKGLKLGIYSSPGPMTCGKYLGTYQHEDQDAATWAAWGIDYIKYDLCSYSGVAGFNRTSRDDQMKPYIVMRQSLDKVNRDIVYSLCQYGNSAVWEWGGGEQVGGNLWRTTGDITDNWRSMSRIGFAQGDHSKFAGAGHWNDPDMLVVGQVGWGRPHPTHLTPNEQVTHITLWSMLSAPLLIGCDMTKLDKFTTDLLTNAEVLDIDQDPLGQPAVAVSKDGTSEVWARRLFDGTIAVALFNRGTAAATIRADWSKLADFTPDKKPLGKQPVRDLWLQKDLGEQDRAFEASVPPHGAVLVKIGTPAKQD